MAQQDPAALIGQIFGGAIGKVVSGLTDALAPLSKSVAQGEQSQDKASSGLAMFAAGLGGAATAANAAVGAIQGVIGKMGEWVGALSPGTMEQLNRAVRDLQATFGVAFKPAIEILTSTFKEIGGIVLPVMEQLRPVIEQVTNTFVANLIPNVKLVADIFTALMPVLEVIAVLFELVESVLRPVIAVLQIIAVGIGAQLKVLLVILTPLLEALKVVSAAFDGLGQIVSAMATIFRVLSDMLGAFLKSIAAFFSTKGIMDELNKVIATVIKTMVVFVATIMKFFGVSLQPLIDAFSKKSGETAAEPPAFKTFEAVGKDLALAAAGAGGGGKATTEDLLKETVAELKKMQEGTSEGNKTVKDTLDMLKGIKSAVEAIRDAKNFVQTGLTYAKDAAAGAAAGAAFGPLGTLAVAGYRAVRG